MLAMDVNDNAGCLTPSGLLWFIANIRASTGGFCRDPASLSGLSAPRHS
jgi:hypothetical protein